MDLLSLNTIDGVLKWILGALAILFAYILVKEIIKLFSRVDEEMWDRRDQEN
jgi:hypothetical protein